MTSHALLMGTDMANVSEMNVDVRVWNAYISCVLFHMLCCGDIPIFIPCPSNVFLADIEAAPFVHSSCFVSGAEHINRSIFVKLCLFMHWSGVVCYSGNKFRVSMVKSWTSVQSRLVSFLELITHKLFIISLWNLVYTSGKCCTGALFYERHLASFRFCFSITTWTC